MVKRTTNYFSSGVQDIPDVMIIGVQKSGTTALFNLLSKVQGVNASARKEVHFFDYDHNYERGLDWYKSWFSKGEGIRFEATPRYLYDEKVPVRIEALQKKIKFIVLLREPISRAYSAWKMYRDLANDEKTLSKLKVLSANNKSFLTHRFFFSDQFPSFTETVKAEMTWIKDNSNIVEPSIVRRGFYKQQIQRWLKCFERKDFLFIETSPNGGQRIESKWEAICSFLSIPYIPIESSEKINDRKSNEGLCSEITDEVESLLNGVYGEKNRGLEKLIGLDLGWPSLN